MAREPDELNFARELLAGREPAELSDGEVLRGSADLLGRWMSGQDRMERPKLYDHYALPLAALCRELLALQERVRELEAALEQRGDEGRERP